MNLDAVVTWVVLPILGLALVLTVARLIRGPSLPDRVVALDLMSSLGIGFIAAYAVLADQSVLLDIASVTALISFLGVIAFAYYLEKGEGVGG
jgi:multicomponent Na+:H+ antiporter subunit F